MKRHIADQVVDWLERSKHSKDARYIQELERIICNSDDVRVWSCDGKGCDNYCEYDDEGSDDDDAAWKCHCCGAEGRKSAQLCVNCMPDPYPECSKCGLPFCPDPDCTYNATHRVCGHCAYDPEDLAALDE